VLGTITLLGHRDVYERLARRDAPNLAASVIDELMRYLSIVQAEVERLATEDLTLGGERVRAGDYLGRRVRGQVGRVRGRSKESRQLELWLRLAVPSCDLNSKDDHSIYGVNALPVSW